jgi:hypothetical protein
MSDPKRAPGRPAIAAGESSTRIAVTAAASDYDRAFEAARRQGVTVPELLREGLRCVLAGDDGDR